jgi:hypothetical protein
MHLMYSLGYGKETIGWLKSETEMGQFVGLRTLISWSDHLLQDEIQIGLGCEGRTNVGGRGFVHV